MARKVCAVAGCPVLTDSSYCREHRAERERARGTRQQRGYGADHDRRRAAIVNAMNAGTVVRCIDCRTVLTPQTLHLGHTDDRTAYRGAQCVQCNDGEAGRKSHRYR
jgi:hypothetical protein